MAERTASDRISKSVDRPSEDRQLVERTRTDGLHTREKATENQALYLRIGYVEYEQRWHEDFSSGLHAQTPRP